MAQLIAIDVNTYLYRLLRSKSDWYSLLIRNETTEIGQDTDSECARSHKALFLRPRTTTMPTMTTTHVTPSIMTETAAGSGLVSKRIPSQSFLGRVRRHISRLRRVSGAHTAQNRAATMHTAMQKPSATYTPYS
jgi:hypothetical protein